MWDLPGPGLEPVSPALAGGFLTIAPPGELGSPEMICFVTKISAKLATAAVGTYLLLPSSLCIPVVIKAGPFGAEQHTLQPGPATEFLGCWAK